MLKQRIIKVCFFTLMIAFHLCLNSLVLAEDCADEKDVTQTPTPPGNAEYLEPWREQYRPTIYASSETITAEGSITLWVDSGGLACSPYTWAVSGTGYSLDKSTTENDFETVTLTAPASTGTCGTDYDIYTTVTVEDTCGLTDSATIRNTAGKWVSCYSFSQACSSGAFCDECDSGYLIIGNHRIYHGCCYKGYGSCGNNPYSYERTCSEDGWKYTFSSTACTSGTPSCPTPPYGPIAPWRMRIYYWSCP